MIRDIVYWAESPGGEASTASFLRMAPTRSELFFFFTWRNNEM